MVKISVVTPIYNAETYLLKTLRALEAQSLSQDEYELILIDNCSDDGSYEIAKSFAVNAGFKVQIKRHSQNLGAWAGYNSGARSASGKIVIFLDQDCVPHPDLLSEHVKTHAEADDPIAVIGRFMWHEDLEANPLRYLFRPNEKTLLTEPDDLQNMGVDQFITGNCSVRQDSFMAIGGFDEDFIYGFGDSEFGYRWRKLGYRIVGNIDAIVYHYRPITFSEQLARRYRIGTDAAILCDKHPELADSAVLKHAKDRSHLHLFFYALLEYFHYQGIREGLGIQAEDEKLAHEILLQQNWERIAQTRPDEPVEAGEQDKKND